MVTPTHQKTQALPAEGINYGGRLRCNLELCLAVRKSTNHWTIQQDCRIARWINKQATHTAILPFESLSDEARRADVLPGLRPNSLVSVGKLADADYTTIFHP
jgi:hypothetical protein